MSTENLFLRPHHALCLLLFSPEGHSKPYSEIMYKLIDSLKSNPKKEISLQIDLDVICGYCPHNKNNSCGMADEVDKSDNAILMFCNLIIDEKISWENLRLKLIDKIITSGKLHEACKGCQFIPRCNAVCVKGEF